MRHKLWLLARTVLWPLARRYAFDVAVVFAAVGAVIELANADDPEGPTRSLWVMTPCVLAITLPLVARRRFPFAAPVATLVAGAATSFLEPQLIPWSGFLFLTVLTAAFLLGMLRERPQAFTGLALAIGLVATVVRNTPQEEGFGEALFISIAVTVVWLAGLALGHKLEQAEARAARAESEREEKAREAVAEERARIARELHDVVAHSVSVMTVQAGAVRRLLKPDQQREREALETIETTGRQALNEMRRLLGILRQAEGADGEGPELAPQPGIDSLERLVRQVRRSGMPVDLRVEGERYDVAPTVDIAVYRVVQEALTNALKHAAPAHAEVVLRYGEEGLELEVSNDGRDRQNGGGGAGHGLEGMRERIAFTGGTLHAGPRDGGGFVVRAQIPLPNEGPRD
jgi:signal transduction histidine kinase